MQAAFAIHRNDISVIKGFLLRDRACHRVSMSYYACIVRLNTELGFAGLWQRLPTTKRSGLYETSYQKQTCSFQDRLLFIIYSCPEKIYFVSSDVAHALSLK